MSNQDSTQKVDPKSPKVTFDYIKSNCFRVVHVDGGMISPASTGKIHLVFYSERPAIPRRVIHELEKDGTIGKIVDTDTRQSIVREIDFNAVMDISVVKALIESLQNALNHVSKSDEE